MGIPRAATYPLSVIATNQLTFLDGFYYLHVSASGVLVNKKIITLTTEKII